MNNLTKISEHKSIGAPKETLLDKTTRIVRRINDDEADVRHAKTARLRKARFESEAASVEDTIEATPKRARNRR